MPIQCEIVSQDREVFSGDVDIVVAPGTDGEMGILPNHTPLLTTLQYGVIKVRYQGKEDVFAVAGGVMEVRPNRVTVLANSAESIDEIDETRAEEARQRAEELLAQGPPADTDAYLAIEAALRRSKLRLDVVSRYRRSRRSRSYGSGTGE